MRRYLVLILVLSLILTSCAKVNESKEPINTQPEINQPQQVAPTPTVEVDIKKDNNIDTSYFGQYQMSDEGFSKYVQDNAIDKDYEVEATKFQASPEFNTQGGVELESKYIDLWDKELNNTYNNLIKKLNVKAQEKLRESQKGWLQYHTKESEFIVESWDDLGLGSQGRVQSAMAVKSRIRQRVLQLMEYNFMLGEEVVFLYKGIDK
jgi:uncharacterized protein YecT (DUF1311 family)